jgi:hypothetical protein
VSASDLAVVAALVFAGGALSARLERFDVTAPIVFVAAGLVLTHGPLAVLSVVLFSVVAHGATAEPLARRYGPLLAPAAKLAIYLNR